MGAIDVSEDAFITTVDNPYSPFTEFIQWYKHDALMGYNTCGILDRLSSTSRMFGDSKNEEAIDNAMLKMIALDYENKYIIVHPDDYENGILRDRN